MAVIQPEILRDELGIKIAVPVYNEDQVLIVVHPLLPQPRSVDGILQ